MPRPGTLKSKQRPLLYDFVEVILTLTIAFNVNFNY